MSLVAQVTKQQVLHAGFNRLCEYTLNVPSLDPAKPVRHIEREVLHCSDSVVVLIYAPEVDSFVLGREFRTGVFFNAGSDDPYIFECVAGMIDKDLSAEETARAEVWEEAGLRADKLELIATVYSSPGRITEKSHVFYNEIAGTPIAGLHGISGEEEIATQIIKRTDAYQMMDTFKIIDGMTLLALNWFRAKHCQI